MLHFRCRAGLAAKGSWFVAGAIVQATLLAGGAAATENGGNNYPIGVNTILAGLQPPPGSYGYVYLTNVTVQQLL
jgi:hypothetical protein